MNANFNSFNFAFNFGSNTTTTAAPQASTFVLRLRHRDVKITADTHEEAAEKLQEINEKMVSLIAILESYGEWYDQISNDLHDWGCDILSVQLPKCGTDEERVSLDKLNAALRDIHAFSSQQIEVLFKKILTNPLSPQQTLHAPLCDRHWLWEKTWLDKYLELPEMQGRPKYSPFEPYDNKVIIAAQPHEFVNKVLLWANENFSIQAAGNRKSLATDASHTSAPPDRLEDYIKLANNAVGIRNQRLMQKMMKAFTAQFADFAKQKEGEVAAAKERSQQEQAVHQQATNERIRKMEAQQEANRTTAEAMNSENQRKIAEEKMKQEEIICKLQEKDAQMQRLRQQIIEMQRQIAAMHSASRKDSCNIL